MQEPGPNLLAHLLNDFARLQQLLQGANAEDASLFLHLIANRFHDTWLARNLGATDWSSEAKREEFETAFTNDVVNPASANWRADVHALRERAMGAHALKDLVTEIEEKKALTTADGQAYRRANLPCLFTSRQHVDLQSFAAQFCSDPQKSVAFPLFRLFLDHFESLRALKFLPDVTRWQRLCSRFNRRLRQREAQEMSVAQVLREAQDKKWGTLEVWQQSYNGLKEAWNVFSERLGDEKQNFQLRHECKVHLFV